MERVANRFAQRLDIGLLTCECDRPSLPRRCLGHYLRLALGDSAVDFLDDRHEQRFADTILSRESWRTALELNLEHRWMISEQLPPVHQRGQPITVVQEGVANLFLLKCTNSCYVLGEIGRSI
jgi:hypothetical protein